MTSPQRAQLEWPLQTFHSNIRKLVKVIYRVPQVMEFTRKGLVTEVYDYGDPAHRDMIDRAVQKLGYEIVSMSDYDETKGVHG